MGGLFLSVEAVVSGEPDLTLARDDKQRRDDARLRLPLLDDLRSDHLSRWPIPSPVCTTCPRALRLPALRTVGGAGDAASSGLACFDRLDGLVELAAEEAFADEPD
jgi:hypothetical protein